MGLAACGDDDAEEGTAASSVSSSSTVPLAEAISLAQVRLGMERDDELVGVLITQLCEGARTGQAETFTQFLRDASFPGDAELATAIGALTSGAELRCPDQAGRIEAVTTSAYEEISPDLPFGEPTVQSVMPLPTDP